MLELKVVRRGRQVALSPHQVAFHAKHADLRCPTFILVQYQPAGTSHAKKAELLLYGNDQAVELVKRGIDTEPLARWGHGAINWIELRKVLLEA